MGYIYIIQAGDEAFFKIGQSAEYPARRMKELQTGNHRKLKLVRTLEYSDYGAIERLLQNTFKDHQSVGEWFNIQLDQIDEKIKYLAEFAVIVDYEPSQEVPLLSATSELSDKSFICTVCNQTFNTRQARNAHMSAHPKANAELIPDNAEKIVMIADLLNQGLTKSQILVQLGFTNSVYWRKYSTIIDQMLAPPEDILEE